MNTTTTPHHTTETMPRWRAHRRRWLSVLAAMATSVATWAVAVQGLGVVLLVERGDDVREVGSAAVLLTPLLVGFAAWGLLVLLERVTARARTVWTVVASVVLLLSLAGPVTAVTTGATVVLLLLHLEVGAILIGGLLSTPTRRPTDR